MEQSERLSYESPLVLDTFEAHDVMGMAEGTGQGSATLVLTVD